MHKFKVPKQRYQAEVSVNGKTFTSPLIEKGQTATPLYNPKTKKITFDIKPTTITEEKKV